MYHRFDAPHGKLADGLCVALSDGECLVVREGEGARLPRLSDVDSPRGRTVHQIAVYRKAPVYCFDSSDHRRDANESVAMGSEGPARGGSEIGAASPAGPTLESGTYRELHSVLPAEHLGLLARAIQILDWDKTTRYCPACGRPTVPGVTECAKTCECGYSQYPRLAPAMIVAVIRDGKLLLGQSPRFKGQFHSILAGFVEPGESVEECVQREVWEEVHLRVKDVIYWGSQPWPFPHSLMLGYTATYESGEIDPDPEEILHADWYAPEDLPEVPGEVSIAGKIIRWFVETYGEEK